MASIMSMLAMIDNDLCNSSVTTEAATDLWIDVVSAQAFHIGLSIVRLDDGVISGLNGGTVDNLTGIAVVLSVNMLTEMSMLELAAVEVTSEVTSPEESSILVCEACSRCTTAACDCRASQTRMPSYHVCPRSAFPALTHFPNQEPPRLQQLRFPDFWMMPHLGHTELISVVVTAAAVGICSIVKYRKRKVLCK